MRILQTLQGVGNTESTMLLTFKCIRNPQQTKNTKQNFRAFKSSALLQCATLYLHMNISDRHIAFFSEKQTDLCSSGIFVRHTYVYKESIVKYQRERNIYIYIHIYIYLFIYLSRMFSIKVCHRSGCYFMCPFE